MVATKETVSSGAMLHRRIDHKTAVTVINSQSLRHRERARGGPAQRGAASLSDGTLRLRMGRRHLCDPLVIEYLEGESRRLLPKPVVEML